MRRLTLLLCILFWCAILAHACGQAPSGPTEVYYTGKDEPKPCECSCVDPVEAPEVESE
jgi:hypothetical protein